MVGAVLGLGPAIASAQTPEPPLRGDVHGTLGWFAAEAGSSGPFDNSTWHNSFFGGVGVGWHWTENLKTEIDAGGGTADTAYLSTSVVTNGITTYRGMARRSQRWVIGVSQQYQFFQNAWFHPHLAAGADFTREQRTDEIQAAYVYDPVTRAGNTIEPARIERSTNFAVRPFVAAGFKAYMTPRTFFRSDRRVGFKSGIDETLLRFGFGFDF